VQGYFGGLVEGEMFFKKHVPETGSKHQTLTESPNNDQKHNEEKYKRLLRKYSLGSDKKIIRKNKLIYMGKIIAFEHMFKNITEDKYMFRFRRDSPINSYQLKT
jgi:hypothetical protein